MSHNTLPTVAELSGEMRERLAKVKYVFTDLDATMLAPGSCVLRDNDGNPSTKLVEAVVALARAGIQVVPTSGRNRTMIHEDARVLGLNSYIGEMGGLVMYDLKANDWEYLTGDMPYDSSCGLTPHQVIESDEISLPQSLVRAGVGLSLLREDVALPASERGEVVIWPHARVGALLGFIYPRAAEHEPAIVATLSLLRTVWGLPPPG